MKNYSLYALSLLLFTNLSGCGGGGEESQPSTSSEIEPTPVSSDSDNNVTTSELISNPDFDLITVTELKVTLPMSPSATTSYFVNICTDFAQAADGVTINYASCKLRTSLSSIEQQFTLSLSNTETQLIAQIWPLVNNATPISIYWDIKQSGDTWQVVF